MKRNIFVALALFAVITAKGQTIPNTRSQHLSIQQIDARQLEKRKKEMFGNTAWKTIAGEIKSHLSLENNAIKYMKIVELPNNTKEQLFAKARKWAENNFNTPECMIRSIDNSNNSITVQGFVNKVVEHAGFTNAYEISLKPIVTIQLKNEKARVTFTVAQYNVHKETWVWGSSYTDEIWNISKCYPFSMYDEHPEASAKALVMTHVCATMYMEIIEKTLKFKQVSGSVSDNNENW